MALARAEASQHEDVTERGLAGKKMDGKKMDGKKMNACLYFLPHIFCQPNDSPFAVIGANFLQAS